MGNFLLKKSVGFHLEFKVSEHKGEWRVPYGMKSTCKLQLVTYIRFASVAANPSEGIRLVRGNWCKALECKKCPEKCPLHWDAIQAASPSKFTSIYTDKRGQHKN
jgi:hypothetical protein